MRLKKLSQKQREIFDFCKTDETTMICDGSVRSGKTTIMTLAFLAWAMQNYDRTNFAICGKTVQSAERNILRPLMEVEGLGAALALSYKVSTRVLTVRCGARVNWFYLFGGKDESSYMLIQGITLAGVLFDEVALMPQSFVEQATARAISFENPKYFLNCNPESPANWVYKKYIEQPPAGTRHIHFLLEDNPILTPQMIERTKAMYSGVFYDRYILGLWRIAEGLVYPMFDRERNVTSERGGPGRYWISSDYGTQNPTVFALWREYGGKAVMEKEYYHSGRESGRQKTDEEYYQDLEAFADGYRIERVVLDPSAASFAECIRRHGKFSVWKANNAVLDGIRFTGACIKSGIIKFHESCKNAFREFGLYSWDKDAGEDRVIKENDHVCDSIRYFCMTVLRREIKK
jgi:PBSX family phage terminase large subunit|nr:MAG TPA: large terminase [Bacteriophage sp.]